jgi:hypothetical protein
MKLSYKKYAQLMDEMVAEGYDVLEASEMIFTEEQVWEEVENWVNSLLEEGYDLSDYTWEEMYESYIEEQVPSNKDMIRKGLERADTQAAFSRAAEKRTGIKTSTPAFSRPASARPQQGLSGSIPAVPGTAPAPRGASSAARPAGAASSAPASSAARPAGAASSAPASSTAAKPAPSSTASTPMQQWEKENPTLAAASAERARIRGTAQTDNPLMKDFKSKMSLTPSVQSPDVEKLGKGNQSLVNNPNAAKAAASKPKAYSTPAATTGTLGAATAAASKPVAFSPTGSAPDTSKAYRTPAATTGTLGAATAAASKPLTGFSLSGDTQKKQQQQKINAGMEIKGNKLQEDLKVNSYGRDARPDSLLEAYQAIYNS